MNSKKNNNENDNLNEIKINWFPGHMAKGMREIEEKAVVADLFVILLDVRAPLSCYNKSFDKIAPNKPRLFVFSKIDLGDKDKYNKIKEHFGSDKNVVFVDLKKPQSRQIILKKIDYLLKEKVLQEQKKGLNKPRLRVFVLGVPNTGKSTFINLLLKEKKVKVGNMPGITRGQQWIKVDNILLLDTPGILWPNLDDQDVAIKLSIIGSIRSEIIPSDFLFKNTYKIISKNYPEILTNMNLFSSNDENKIHENLLKIAEQKNMFIKNGEYDLERARKWFYNFIKNSKGLTYDF
ncbi:ribosome biogenesis GTPase YlqF [Mycoplasmopsis pulmonis]|uniref:ribosome biogenesis GTPase YlqF n=1 Tax=Mycoplasmopsis pulmonis TaxID=2107 RepID=UPI0010050A60|nr:ribosome biogenesis GTPase YlqF [Mycoplasmopsis pulmonis]MDZ7293266.1 ribosome biogenesis GTPase YlqF [Mycoplasmopsis pulmonis]VEU68069.1 GTPase [Mycoplasmopsis pulmonis]